MTELNLTFGKYVLLEVLGEGAMARVYRAVRSGPMGFRKPVAIKQILPHVAEDEKVIQALINEARVGGYLQHRNLVEVYEFDQAGDTYYIAMEFVAGYTLEDVMRRTYSQGLLPPRIALEIAASLCDGMAYAHSAVDETGRPMNLVHRDLKPSNVMVSHAGVVKIMDFGIAKAATNLFHTTAAGITKGTPVYMSPEQVRGKKLDKRSDLFGLASLIAELITGEVVFRAEQLFQVLQKVVQAEIGEMLAAVDQRIPEMVPVLKRAMAQSPEGRYPDAAELGRDIRAIHARLPGDEALAGWIRPWIEGGALGGEDTDEHSLGEVGLTRELEIEEMDERATTTSALAVHDGLIGGGLVFHGSVVMVTVDPGEFWMGSADDEKGRYADETRHRVRLGRSFLVATTPVTQALYAEVAGDEPGAFVGAQLPVESVSWYDAVRFCNALSERENLEPAYRIDGTDVSRIRRALGFRLPTEAEWEYAARAGQEGAFSGSTTPGDVGWYWTNAGGCTQPVGKLRPNSLGLYDMTGNVWEWVWDVYGSYPGGGVTVDPTGPESGTLRVGRGGSWRDMERDVRVACRRCQTPPGDTSPTLGFRLARSLP